MVAPDASLDTCSWKPRRRWADTYTAVALGEILFARHFTASKHVNPFSANAKNEVSTKMFANNDGTFEKVTKVVPEPQHLMTMLDAFDSVKWALIFARWRPNGVVEDYIARWQDMVRDNHNKFPQIRAFWKKAFWEVAMELRSKKTFAQDIQLNTARDDDRGPTGCSC